MRPSLQKVAERAGVSRMTASNVMRGREAQTSTATRDRVLEAMRELDYVPVAPPSKQNRHVETRIIALSFDCIDFEDIWGAQLYRGMRQAARAARYDLLTLLRLETDQLMNQEEVRFLDRRSDGVIFVLPQNRNRVLETMTQHRISAVTCCLESGLDEVPSVVLENEGAMRQATEHLIEKGHRRIVHLMGDAERWDHRMRQRGYERAMEAAHLRPLLLQHDEAGQWRQTLDGLIAKGEATACASFNDDSALQLWSHLTQQGLMVPRDFSLVGMDNLPEAQHLGLTTMRFSTEEIGRRAVESLVKMLNGAKPRECSAVVPVELIERTSVLTR